MIHVKAFTSRYHMDHLTCTCLLMKVNLKNIQYFIYNNKYFLINALIIWKPILILIIRWCISRYTCTTRISERCLFQCKNRKFSIRQVNGVRVISVAYRRTPQSLDIIRMNIVCISHVIDWNVTPAKTRRWPNDPRKHWRWPNDPRKHWRWPNDSSKH